MKSLFKAVGVLCLSSLAAFSAITPELGLGSPTPFTSGSCTQMGGCYLYTYELSLAPKTQLTPVGEQVELQLLVIYDFAGFTGYYDSTLFELIATPLVGPTGPQTTPPDTPYATFPLAPDPADNPAIQNLVFQYIGGGTLEGALDDFEFLSIESTFNLVTVDNFRGQGSKNVPGDPSDEDAIGTFGSVEVPTAIPEPSTYAMLGSALLGLGLLRRFGK
jgi:hypothetical protein